MQIKVDNYNKKFDQIQTHRKNEYSVGQMVVYQTKRKLQYF